MSKLNSSFPGEAFRDHDFEKIIFSDAFLTQSGKEQQIDRKWSASLPKPPSMSPKKLSEKSFFSVENFVAVIFLSDFELLFLHFWQESLAGLSKLCFYVFDVLFADFISKTVIFLKTIGIEQKHFRFLGINNGQCCQKINFHVQKKIEEKKLLGKLTTVFSFWA